MILILDIGTSSVRAAVMDGDGTLVHEVREELLPQSPADGLVEFDAAKMRDVTMALAQNAIANVNGIQSVGVTNQRASTIVWDRATGQPVGPGLGWQDLRTLGDCLVFQADGFAFAPNQTATKAKHLWDLVDPERKMDLCFGTVDSWLIWNLTQGEAHVTDPTNAGVTGLFSANGTWNAEIANALSLPLAAYPKIVPSSGDIAPATALTGAPMIRSIAGDQQASLVGQSCVTRGAAKITFGTGGMFDMVLGDEPPAFSHRGPNGTFPIATWQIGNSITWGIEAIMLSAGTAVTWLRDDLQLIDSVAQSHEIASQCEQTDGVVFVPALLGLGTPQWDYGARGAFFGITRGTSRAHMVRAVLEGIAQRGADLVEAAEKDSSLQIERLRVDGGMSANPTFVQALANATTKVVEISPVLEATARGAGFLAGVADHTWSSLDDVASLWQPKTIVEPNGQLDRQQWQRAVERASSWYPELSAFDF